MLFPFDDISTLRNKRFFKLNHNPLILSCCNRTLIFNILSFFFFFFLEENSTLFHYVLVTLKGWVSQSLVSSTFYRLLSPVSANPNSDAHLISVLHHLGKALVDVFRVPPSLAVHSLFLSLWNPHLTLRCGVDCGAYSACLECLFPHFSYFLCVGSVWL